MTSKPNDFRPKEPLMRKIEKLTAQQERELVAFRERMWSQGTSCEPANRKEAEDAICAAYREIGRPAPRFFWMSSPMTCALALHVLQKASENAGDGLGAGLGAGLGDGLRAGLGDGLGDGLRAGLWAGLGDGLGDGLRAGLGDGLRDGLWDGLGDGLRAGLRAGLWDGLRDGLWDGLRDGLWDGLRAGLWAGLGAGLRAGLRDGLRAGLGDGLRAGLWAGLGDGLRDGLRAGLGDGLGDGLWAGLWDGLGAGLGAGLRAGLGDGRFSTFWWGQMDAYWLAFYRFGSDLVVQKPDLLRRLEIMERISASCGFWYPRDGICIVSDRFLNVRWDNARNRHGMPFRLHAEDGPAVSFRDSWSLYYWHGFRLPVSHEWIIADRSKITKASILAEKNTELRRIMCEVAGWPAAIQMLGGKTIARDELHGQPRELIDVTIGPNDRVRLVRLVNGTVEEDGTRHEFVEGVPLDVKTPHESQAWAYGIHPKHYREAVRT